MDKRSRRRFTKEFKADTVALVRQSGKSIAEVCRDMGLAKSAFYAWQTQQPSTRARADDHLINEIRAIHDDSRCTYGAPRVHAELRRRGKRVGRKRVARLMRNAGLVGRCPRRFRRTTLSDPTTHVQDLVQRQFRPSAPNQLWCSDISYIRTWEGWLYFGSHPGCLFQKGRRLGAHRPSAH